MRLMLTLASINSVTVVGTTLNVHSRVVKMESAVNATEADTCPFSQAYVPKADAPSKIGIDNQQKIMNVAHLKARH